MTYVVIRRRGFRPYRGPQALNKPAPYAIYFEWFLGLRFGGPPGYLANLREGLEAIGSEDRVEFIAIEGEPEPESKAQRGQRRVVQQALFDRSIPEDADELEEERVVDTTIKSAAFYARTDWLHLSPSIFRKLEPQSRSIIHVHTTTDAVKVHNSLTRHGTRHNVLLVLTTHCPEIPAKEWAEREFAQGAPAQSADTFFHLFKDMDYLAFHYSDVLVFPCPEAMAPYLETMPDYKKLFGQKDTRFLTTGAKRLEPSASRAATRRLIGIPTNAFVVSYLGRHNTVKGYDILSRAALSLLPEEENLFFLIGGKEGPLSSPKHDRWIEFGWTDQPANLLEASDLFVLPNRQTYFDLMLIEVLSMGKIVIASNTGGNRYFAGKSEGIILYDKEEELHSAILKVKSLSRARRKAMEEQNRSLYEAELTIERFGSNYLALLDAIASDYNALPKDKVLLPVEASDRPAVSIIIPVYNVEKYLADCLQSVVDQTWEDFEVLVVDDGSTDDSAAVINHFVETDSRFRKITRKNGGLSAARNTGLNEARGEYIAFLDSDDAFAPVMIEALLNACRENNTKLAVCGVALVADNGKLESEVTSFIDDQIVYPHWRDGKITTNVEVVTSLYPSAWNKLYHRSLFSNVRYNSGLYYEDHPVFYKIILSLENFSYVNQPLYIHRDRETGRITRDGSRKVLDIFMVLDLIESNIRASVPVDRARILMAKVITRLVWERFWVVDNPVIRFKLVEYAMMRYDIWDLKQDDIIRYQDRVIQRDFYKILNEIGEKFGGWWSVDKARMPLQHIVTVEDHTPGFMGVSTAVEFEKTHGFILVHPMPDVVTTACVHGLGFFGPGRLRFTACLENDDAQPQEFRTLIAPFTISDRDLLLDETGLAFSHSTPWQTLRPFVDKPFDITLPEGSPTMAIYFQSRTPAGSTGDYAWVRVRGIRSHAVAEK